MVDKSFYEGDDVVKISKELLGKFLCTLIDGELTTGMIVETEAYRAPNDKASHAWNCRRTNRNEMMYAEGGVCYVYSCYGMHSLFNIVTNKKNIPHAILIRAIEPCEGIETMARRRGVPGDKRELTSGPGKLSQALGITTAHNGLDLQQPPIWVEEREISTFDIVETTRIGIDYAGEHALLPWRFYVNGSRWISKR